MCLLIETILIKNTEFQNIEYHNDRFNKTRAELFRFKIPIYLEELIIIPQNLEANLLYRCRVTYSHRIEKVEFIPYKRIPIKTLQIVYCDTIEYPYKYENRQQIDELKNGSKADDILIIKNGLITDTSIANIVLRKEGKWFTPKQPLLKGTQREKLICENQIIPVTIRLEDLKDFDAFGLINALRPYSEMDIIECKYILTD